MNARRSRPIAIALCFGSASLVTAMEAGAQTYPNRTIRMVVPFTAGGGSDTNARIVSQRLSEQLGVAVVIDNRPGAGSMLGTELVVRAPPDGYTLLTTSPELSINPSLQPKVPYDALKDLAPVSQTVTSQYVLLTHPSVPAKSVKELVVLARARPGQLTFGSSGNGSAPHIGNVLLQNMTGTKLIHVPYKGAAPAAIALMSGDIDVMLGSTAAVTTHVKSGKLRALAVSGAKRFSEMPNIPTVAESGVPGYEVTGWYMILAPAATPRDIIGKLNAEIVRVVNHPTVKERFASIGTEPVGSSPEETAAFLRAEIEKWTPVVKASGARLD